MQNINIYDCNRQYEPQQITGIEELEQENLKIM